MGLPHPLASPIHLKYPPYVLSKSFQPGFPGDAAPLPETCNFWWRPAGFSKRSWYHFKSNGWSSRNLRMMENRYLCTPPISFEIPFQIKWMQKSWRGILFNFFPQKITEKGTCDLHRKSCELERNRVNCWGDPKTIFYTHNRPIKLQMWGSILAQKP